jgi:NADH:ubiquinone oxidoreductase subunit C
MTLDQILDAVTKKFGTKVLGVERPSDRRAYIKIDHDDIQDFVRFVFKDLGLRFNITSAVDTYEGFELLYHFTLDTRSIIVTLRTMIEDKADPHIDTITTITRSAWWIEREIHELFGIEFNGNKDLRPLLLPDDWPRGVYPLRKDFIAPKRDSRKG